MYLISIYFDKSASKRIQRLIDKTAELSGNSFMLDHQVPPHMTISAFETRNPNLIVEEFETFAKTLQSGSIRFVSPGMFLPYVMYVTPVLNEYLAGLQDKVYGFLSAKNGITINRMYKPMQWLPHVTIGKTLDEGQMRDAFAVMQKHFAPFEACVERIGLARTNPHEDITVISIR